MSYTRNLDLLRRCLFVPSAIMVFLLPTPANAEEWIGEALDMPTYDWNSEGIADYGYFDILDGGPLGSHDGVECVSMSAFAEGFEIWDPVTEELWVWLGSASTAVSTGPVSIATPSVCSFWYQFESDSGIFGEDGASFNGVILEHSADWVRSLFDIQAGPNEFVFRLGVIASGVGQTYSQAAFDQFSVESMPSLSIADATVVEGDDGETPMSFNVSLSHAVSFDVLAEVSVSSSNAEYIDPPSEVLIPAGTTQAQIVVPVIGDTAYEGDEQVLVLISNPLHAFLADAEGVGTIVDDDPFPPHLGIQLVGDAVQLSWDTAVGWAYTLQSTTDALSPDGWSNVPPYVDLPGDDASFVTAPLGLTPPRCFFRIKAMTVDP